jgi:hypothetical protein
MGDACARGDMTEFMESARHRAAVYEQSMQRIQETLALTKMRLQQQQMLLMSDLMLQGSDYAIAAVQGPGHDR